MKFNQENLIEELLSLTENVLQELNMFKSLSEITLNSKPNADSWSILECIGHLNLYADFYLPEIEKAVLKAGQKGAPLVYKSSLLGDFFVNSIKAGNTKKMRAPKNMTPQLSDLNPELLDVLFKKTEKLKALIGACRNKDLVKSKTAISLTRLLKLRLGDTLRFMVYHNERHILQAKRAGKL